MITLTNRPTRRLVWSLWLVIVGGAGALLTAVLWVAGAGAWTLAGPVLVAAGLAAGRALPQLTESLYRSWRRLSGGVARRAVRLLTRAAFLVVAIVGRAGGEPSLAGTVGPEGGWRSRAPLSLAYDSVSGEPVSAADHGWLGSLWAWARRTGNGWIWALVPLLGLLRLVSTERSAAADGTTYTLY